LLERSRRWRRFGAPFAAGRFKKANKPPLVQVMLKGFTAVDENHGDFVLKPFESGRVVKNIDFAPDKLMKLLQLFELRFDLVAQAAVWLRIDDNFR
jgi:DNA-binding LytR/AlgR family response regulator